MPPAAYLTVLWGEIPIGSAHVAPGQSVGIGDGGVITRAPGRAAPALMVRMHARGATVSRPEGACRRLPTGADVRIAITEPGSLPVYRRRMAWEPAPLTLRIAVANEHPIPRRRPGLSARLLGALASVAAAHAVALVIAASAMPCLAPVDDALVFDDTESTSFFNVDVIDPDVYRGAPDEDRFGDAPAVCTSGPPIGHSIAVRHLNDGDPHLPDHREDGPTVFSQTYDPTRGLATDEAVPTSLWGGNSWAGVDPFSSAGTVRGFVKHPPLATCFDPPPETWSCTGRDERPERATPESVGLIGIGELPLPPEPWQPRRPERVAVGPIAADANVPRWVVASAVRDDVVDSARACYERALADDATLAGRLDVVVKVRGEAVSVKLDTKGNLASSPAFLCCVEHAHDDITAGLPAGTRATGRYAITFGRPDPLSG